jgi:hypothetical protein
LKVQEAKCAKQILQIYTISTRNFLVLVTMLMKDYNLIGRLKSVKRFFLLDQSDFLDQFIDLADEDLRRPVSKTVQVKKNACILTIFYFGRGADFSIKLIAVL